MHGSGMQKGITFGIILFIIVAIPSNFAMYTSLDWPVSFSVGNLIWAVIGFILTGIVFAKIWKL
jgi:ABC-type antimicrobial peptide transport system permease subunit